MIVQMMIISCPGFFGLLLRLHIEESRYLPAGCSGWFLTKLHYREGNIDPTSVSRLRHYSLARLYELCQGMVNNSNNNNNINSNINEDFEANVPLNNGIKLGKKFLNKT